MWHPSFVRPDASQGCPILSISEKRLNTSKFLLEQLSPSTEQNRSRPLVPTSQDRKS